MIELEALRIGKYRLEMRRVVRTARTEPDEMLVASAIGDLDDSALDGIARLGVWRIRADGARCWYRTRDGAIESRYTPFLGGDSVGESAGQDHA